MPKPNPALIFLEPLERLALPYMVVGSYACIAYGAIRDTLDVDIVLTLSVNDVVRLAAAFPLENFYCPLEETLFEEATRSERGHFNVIHHETFFRADVYLPRPDELTRWAFAHRRRFHWVAFRSGWRRRNTLRFTNWNTSGRAAATSTCVTFVSC